MQGSYQNKGLPRPYYMKPTNTKKNSPYNNTPRNFFSTPKRKLLGYIVMMILFGSLMYVISQDIRGSQTQVYEVVVPEKKLEPEGKIAGSSPNDADKESENIELSINMAKGSKGDLVRVSPKLQRVVLPTRLQLLEMTKKRLSVVRSLPQQVKLLQQRLQLHKRLYN